MADVLDYVKVGDVFYAAMYRGWHHKGKAYAVTKYTVTGTPKTMVRLKGDSGIEVRVMRARRAQFAQDDWPLVTTSSVNLYPEGHSKVAKFQAEAARSRALSQAGLVLDQAQKMLRAEDTLGATVSVTQALGLLEGLES